MPRIHNPRANVEIPVACDGAATRTNAVGAADIRRADRIFMT